MFAFKNASLHDMLATPRSSLLLIGALPHLPFAHVNLLLVKPRSMAPNSAMSSLRKLVVDEPHFLLPEVSLSFTTKLSPDRPEGLGEIPGERKGFPKLFFFLEWYEGP